MVARHLVDDGMALVEDRKSHRIEDCGDLYPEGD